jgi:FkbM family methyltransferase
MILKLARFLLPNFKYTLIEKKKLDKMPSYCRLKRIFGVKMIIDVGVGDQGSVFLYNSFPGAFFVSINPLVEARNAIKNLPNSLFFEVALGSSPGKTKIEVSKKPSRSSILKRNRHDKYSIPIETRNISITTLDTLMKKIEHKIPCKGKKLLKIDTEGYELEILKGGQDTIEKGIDYIILEAPLTDNFSKSYSFSEIVGFLANKNFEVLQVLKAGNNSIDLLFARKDDELRKKLSYGNV